MDKDNEKKNSSSSDLEIMCECEFEVLFLDERINEFIKEKLAAIDFPDDF